MVPVLVRQAAQGLAIASRNKYADSSSDDKMTKLYVLHCMYIICNDNYSQSTVEELDFTQAAKGLKLTVADKVSHSS